VAIRRTLLDEQLRLGENDALVALKRAWDKALTLLEPEVNRPSFESFFKTAKPISVDGNSCCIGAASELARIFLEKYYHLVKPALEAALGVDMDVTFTVAPKEPPKARAQAAKQAAPPARNISPISQALNDKYTFQTFVTGPSNKMACAAAKAVAENPGQTYNPFFLYGGPGLGKTHLLQAIAHQAMEKHPGIRVAYVSGEIFTSHYVTALQEKRSEDFRQKYRSIDLLLVDDIQFLAGRPQTKEEFFHTFNALYQMNKQIVLCSDRPPREIAPIEERLKSRFEAGLVADISPPDMKTRMAILTAKVKTNGADLPPATLSASPT
jgi:chromosomal replication initiator protein